MPAAEVMHIQTGEDSIELGSQKDGRIKMFFSRDEVEDLEKAYRKIEQMGNILDRAKRRLVHGDVPRPRNSHE